MVCLYSYVDNIVCLNIDSLCVEFFVGVFFGGDIRCRIIEVRYYMSVCFLSYLEIFVIVKVGNFDCILCSQEEVFGFEVMMSNIYFVQVFDVLYDLFEEVVGFLDFEFFVGEDQCIEIFIGVKFYDFVVVIFCVFEKIEGVNDVGVVEGRRNIEFGCEMFVVFFFCFFRFLMEFFYGEEFFVVVGC